MNETQSPGEQGKTATRRQVIAGAALSVGGVFLGSGRAWAAIEEEILHMAEAIHQEPVFKASRKRVYQALTDTAQFKKLMQLGAAAKAGAPMGQVPTEISREMGGAFTIFGGHIIGRQLELLPNERIVQAWRVVDWSSGIYSIARFELVEQGEGTKIKFDHAGFPNGLAKHLAEGWTGNYWEPLERFLG
jgi:activator of HSP90 ATPase